MPENVPDGVINFFKCAALQARDLTRHGVVSSGYMFQFEMFRFFLYYYYYSGNDGTLAIIGYAVH